MDRDTAARLLREQQTEYKRLRQFEIEAAQQATFLERLNAFCRIMSFSQHLPKRNTTPDDDKVRERWIRIRERYEAKRLSQRSKI
ncbi:MAG TPA: hypothetical protein VFA07_04875 [Chthonomonadaceae bacterium]|nr:hypothetical protein [Chthonomonadaceae bacterium]